MRTHWYSTIPALTWILGRYFYRTHWFYIAARFFPYRLNNPKSSNPLEIYRDLYQPWRDRDPFDNSILQRRLTLQRGVNLNEESGRISQGEADLLRVVCDRIDIAFFYPVVVSVDLRNWRRYGWSLRKENSAIVNGSREYLIGNVSEGEYELLFLDDIVDQDFRAIVYDPYHGSKWPTPSDVLRTLIGRCT